MRKLSHDCKIEIASTTTLCAAGTSDVTSSAIDTAGFEGCCFIVPMGTIASTAVTSIKVQQCDTSGGSYADLTGTAVTIADDGDDKTYYVEVVRPREQFLKLVVDRGTQNATVGGVIAVLTGAGNKPVSHGASVSGESHYGVAEGTA
jgi:hypothetical protein